MISREEKLRLWDIGHEAAVAAGAPDPRACADRYLQGAEQRERSREMDAELERQDAYWRRVGGQSPVGSTGNDRRP